MDKLEQLATLFERLAMLKQQESDVCARIGALYKEAADQNTGEAAPEPEPEEKE